MVPEPQEQELQYKCISTNIYNVIRDYAGSKLAIVGSSERSEILVAQGS